MVDLQDRFVMVQGTTRYSGHVEDVFREDWSAPTAGQRVLTKLPPTSEGRGQVVAAIKLVRPIDTSTESVDEVVRPVLEDDTQIAEVVYVPIHLLITVPNGL